MTDTIEKIKQEAIDNATGIDGTSFSSVYIETHDEEGFIESATGFLVESEFCVALVTNLHVVSGKRRNSNIFREELRSIPKAIMVKSFSFAGENKLLHQTTNWIPLYKDELTIENAWYEHPEHGHLVDIAVIPVCKKPEREDIWIQYQQISENIEWKKWYQGDKLLVIGYPYGLQSTLGAIWITGHIATDPDIPLVVDEVSVPAFLLDARTRSGQSGSPVIGRFKKGDTTEYEGKKYELNAGYMDIFLGIYSGRINSDSDLGYVWRPKLVRETIAKMESCSPDWWLNGTVG